jgi:hypothetical protein
MIVMLTGAPTGTPANVPVVNALLSTAPVTVTLNTSWPLAPHVRIPSRMAASGWGFMVTRIVTASPAQVEENVGFAGIDNAPHD